MTYKNLLLEGEAYYGKHVMLTAERCNEQLLDIPTLERFLIQLSDDIDMIRYGDPIVKRFGDGEQIGVSGVQLITTSSITIHTNDAYRDLYLDVFSCKWFSTETIEALVQHWFTPKKTNVSEVLRK